MKIFKATSLTAAMIVVMLVSWAVFTTESWSAGQTLTVPKKCEMFTRDYLNDLLVKVGAPNAYIISVNQGPLKDFCEIIVENKGRAGIVYIDLAKEHIIWGQIISLPDIRNLTGEAMDRASGDVQKRLEEVQKEKDKMRIDVSKIPLDEALILGDKNAAKKVIVFTDLDCGFCGYFLKMAKEIVSKRKDIVFYLKFVPTRFNENSYRKAKSIVCGKSINALEDAYSGKEIPKVECKTDEVDNSIKLSESFGISAKPSFILPDGRLRESTMTEKELVDLIDGKK